MDSLHRPRPRPKPRDSVRPHGTRQGGRDSRLGDPGSGGFDASSHEDASSWGVVMGLKVRVFIYKFIGAWLLLGSLGGVMTVVSGDSDPGPLVTGMDLLLAVAFGVLGYKAWRAGSGLIMRGRANVAAERVRQTPRPPES